jgi:hypothetical protein
MKADSEPENARKTAKTLSLLSFGFMSLLPLVVFYTEDQLSVLDYLHTWIAVRPGSSGLLRGTAS